MSKKMRMFWTVFLIVAVLFVRTLFYKVVFLMLLFVLWRKPLMSKLPERYHKWTTWTIWACLLLAVWVALPRWRTHSCDRVQLVYFDKEGGRRHAPVAHWLASAVFPEAEIVNIGITGVRLASLGGYHSNNAIVRQAQADVKTGKIGNFFKPYRHLGLNNPISGVYAQLFNEKLGTKHNPGYVCRPKHYKKGNTYPLVIFCHGYLGNWQLYQGIWKDLDNAIVLSIGTHDLIGIFNGNDINRIFSFYIPALERMGYRIDREQIHLMGLSNGGSAIDAAMRSKHVSHFKSLTSISCNLGVIHHVPCQVNLIGGGKDGSSNRMPQQYRQLKNMGVDADLFYNKEENHFIVVNERKEIVNHLKQRMELE